MSSPNPGSNFSQTASVASGVISRRAGPVPPVVMTRQQFCWSHISFKTSASCAGSSGTIRATGVQSQERTSDRYSWIAGPPRSSYSPRLALSETVMMPIFAVMMLYNFLAVPWKSDLYRMPMLPRTIWPQNVASSVCEQSGRGGRQLSASSRQSYRQKTEPTSGPARGACLSHGITDR